jgi:AcrR family transcriptional regulator
MSTDLAARRRRTRSEAREDNRLALLEAASELIVEVGYSAAQLDEIAARAGLTKGAIYSIFGGKLELLRALVDEHSRRFLPLLGMDVQPSADATAEDVIGDLARTYVKVIRRRDALRLLAFEVDLAGLALRDDLTMTTVQVHERAQTDRLAAALAGRRRQDGAALTAGRASLAANLVLGSLGGLGQRAVTMSWSTRDPQVIATALVAMLDVAAVSVA